jgi:hypothetical protein
VITLALPDLFLLSPISSTTQNNKITRYRRKYNNTDIADDLQIKLH